ncbi:unnamed protein product [Protopolystoma xenopodis]|uniref:Uncharacterized protein n=1 Tax=Protopolystoma xenopodis TaxID=117903 RepID=A0A3S5BBH4_9PLAT|nr:unnamed protein product [Protopolystoma xenopodis]
MINQLPSRLTNSDLNNAEWDLHVENEITPGDNHHHSINASSLQQAPSRAILSFNIASGVAITRSTDPIYNEFFSGSVGGNSRLGLSDDTMVVVCNCGRPAIELTVRKEGPNQGLI